MHDSGLSTSLGYSSDAESAQVKRMRSLNNQCDTNSQRSRRHSFAQIKRIVGSLGLPTFVHERACQLFTEAQEEYGLTKGRSLEGLFAAAIYAACREHELPYLLDEIAAEVSISTQSVRQTYLRVNSEMGLAIRPPSPSNFIPRVVSDVNCDRDVEAHLSDFIQYRATELVKFAEEEAVVQGRNPIGVAAGALYYVAQRNGCKITQHTVAGEWISVHALRQSRTALTDALEEADESVESICAASKDNTDASEGDTDDTTETIEPTAADNLNEVNVVANIDDVDIVDEESPAVSGGQATRQTPTAGSVFSLATVDRAPEPRIDDSGGDEPSSVLTNRGPSVTTGGIWSIPPPHSKRVRYRTATEEQSARTAETRYTGCLVRFCYISDLLYRLSVL
jgi:transcription initiation factor TFIIB